ncbi:putative reverse transcriptase domain-containing protein [Tanacetum coccineum]
MQASRDRQKSYADLKRKPMEFQVEDRVMLKVSPWKVVVRFGKRGKLNPRYVGPFKVLEKIGTVAYKLDLPQELIRVHNTFHVSNLKKCYSDEPLADPLEGLRVDDKLRFVEEPIKIMDQEVKRLKQSHIPIVKVNEARVMSSASSAVTYTSVYIDSEPGRLVALPSPDYVPGPEHPPSPDYVPGPEHPPSPIEVPYVPEPEYPEYLAPSNAEAPLEDQPLPIGASPTALSRGYVADSDPEEDPEEDLKEDHADYPADGGDDDGEPSDDDNHDTGDEDEEPFEDEDDDEKEEHLALANSSTVPVVDLTRLRRARKTVRLEPPMSPSMEARIAEYIPLPPLPPPPSSLHLPPPVPTSLPLPSSPLPPLPVSLFILPLVNHREDIPEAELPPCKRLCLTAPTLRYEVGDSSTAAPRPTGGHRADYGFIGTTYVEIRRRRAEEAGYGIRDVWVDPTEAVEESVDGLVKDRNFHYETARLLDREALVSREAWAHTVGLSSVVHYELQAYRTHTKMQDIRIASQESLMMTLIAQNNMPLRRSSATARAVATASARAAATPITVAAVKQLIEARVSAALANHETLQNSTNGHGDGSHNSETGIRGTKIELVFHISNCAVENQVEFATCTFLGNALTWWNSHMKTVTQDVAYAMDWKTLKKMMTFKYYPRGEIKKLKIELWNLKVKGSDVVSYTLRFQELALMCGRMFHEELEEVEKYVGGLPDMIQGNVMSYQPKMMEKAIEFANDQIDQKVLTITERQAEHKRKLEFNAGNNQGYQQQKKRQNTGRAYTARPGEKRDYTGSLPLCTKCNYHHKGPCAHRCNKCKKIGHLARNCRSSGPNGNNNNHGNFGTTQNVVTCYECGVQGNFKKDCPKH